MRKRELLSRINGALDRVGSEIRGNATGSGGGLYARGLSSEGYAGGYAQALRDVEGLIRDIEPRNDRGYWTVKKP